MLLVGGLLARKMYEADWSKEIRARNQAAQQAQYKESHQRYLNSFAGGIEYFKDPRTNLCFAGVSRAGYQSHAIAVSEVPCDKIPSDLLQLVELE